MKKIMIAALVREEDTYEDYCQAFRALGSDPFISLRPAEFEDADALVLPGSGQDINPELWGEKDWCSNDINDELDAIHMTLLQRAIETGKPVLGICRGMQFINVFFGGTLIQDLSCAAAHKASSPEQYHQILHLPGTFMEDLFGEESEVNTRHHQGVGQIGKELLPMSLWNDGEDSVVESIYHPRYKILGVQWHPEKMFLDDNKVHHEDARRLLMWWMKE